MLPNINELDFTLYVLINLYRYFIYYILIDEWYSTGNLSSDLVNYLSDFILLLGQKFIYNKNTFQRITKSFTFKIKWNKQHAKQIVSQMAVVFSSDKHLPKLL